jgi:hypothetical protein
MTVAQFLECQLNEVGSMLAAVLEDIPERIVDSKVSKCSMSIRSQVLHLCEAYAAVVVVADGGKFQWGVSQFPQTSWEGIKDELFRRRATAVERVLDGTDKAAHIGAEYLGSHDNYHIGQMVTARWTFQPEWDPYTIYRP